MGSDLTNRSIDKKVAARSRQLLIEYKSPSLGERKAVFSAAVAEAVAAAAAGDAAARRSVMDTFVSVLLMLSHGVVMVGAGVGAGVPRCCRCALGFHSAPCVGNPAGRAAVQILAPFFHVRVLRVRAFFLLAVCFLSPSCHRCAPVSALSIR